MHAINFRRLVGEHVGREPKDDLILGGAVCGEQVLHHDECAVVVADHEDQEEPVELTAGGPEQLREVGLGEHARHEHVVFHAIVHHPVMGGVRRGDRLAAVLEPHPHQLDLVPLRHDDPLGEDLEVRTGRALHRPSRDQHRLGMMRDHPGHEADISGIRRAGWGRRKALAGGGAHHEETHQGTGGKERGQG